MDVAVVIPCLNEQDTIATTAQSLGFGGRGRPPEHARLILVDNASTDGTWDELGRIVSEAPTGAVHRIRELERGFVPPRDRGVQFAAALTRERGRLADQTLILQADADTVYLPHYIERMRGSAEENVLLEASIGRVKSPDATLASYRALELRVDGVTRFLEVEDDDEVLIDDKACGYLLADYERWGGLQREYLPDGSEIHAETSRLFLRAMVTTGAKRRRVERAGALTSARRIYENPALNFATAGFPREASWISAFEAKRGRLGQPHVCMSEELSTACPQAVRMRVGHNLILFAILPRIISLHLDRYPSIPALLKDVIAGAEAFDRTDICERPGLVITTLLTMIDEPKSGLQELITHVNAESREDRA